MAGKQFVGSKRERNTDLKIDDGEFAVDSGNRGGVIDNDLASIDARIKRLDRRNAASEPKMFATPLYQYPAAQRQAYHNLVGALAQTIEDNIIRPKDPEILNDLRRREAATHQAASSVSVSILKTRTPNTRYASDGPKKWLEQPGGAEQPATLTLADTWARQSQVPQHVHGKDDVLVLDIRFACAGVDLLGEIPSESRRNVLFPYLTMSLNDKTVLQHMSQHNTFVRFAEEFSREEMRGTLADVIKRSGGMSFFAVRFLHDNKLQVVYNMDLDGVYLGVIVFSLMSANRTPMTQAEATSVRNQVKTEITKEREVDAAKAREPAATITALVKDAEVLEEMERMRQLNETYFKAYSEIAHSANGTRVDRLISRSCPLVVFVTAKSASLLAAQVKYEYYHFAVCQCKLDDTDLLEYKRAYVRAQKRHSQIPSYDSDNESTRN
jgi:hypothetical protein